MLEVSKLFRSFRDSQSMYAFDNPCACIVQLMGLMYHSLIRQTFELGKFISTAGKSIINLVKL